MTSPVHLAAVLDAMQWLTFQASKGLVIPLGKDRKRIFSLDRGFTVHSTALILDDDNQLYLVMRNDPTMQWFVNLPWLKLQVFHQRKPAFLNLICNEVTFPGFSDIKFEGGSLPAFSLKIPIYSNIANGLTTRTTINLGLFMAGETSKEIVLSNTPVVLNLPIDFCN